MTTLVSDLMMGMMGGLAWTCPDGCFAEVGVYQGGSAKILYSIAQKQGRDLFLYDTFSGMPFKGEFDTHDAGMFSDCSVDDIQARYPNSIVCQGIFPESVVKMPRVAFVHADADQYQSTLDICKTFTPLMVKGGMILFDDYYCVPSCIKAVDEFFPIKKILPDGRALVQF
jgi:O-methyltransferase